MKEVKVAVIKRNMSFFELGGETYIDDKKYDYIYKKVHNIEELMNYLGNIEDYLPNVNEYNAKCNEIRVFNESTKIIIKIYGRNKVNITAKTGKNKREMTGTIKTAYTIISGLNFMFE